MLALPPGPSWKVLLPCPLSPPPFLAQPALTHKLSCFTCSVHLLCAGVVLGVVKLWMEQRTETGLALVLVPQLVRADFFQCGPKARWAAF